jgi:hypothetical protein
MKVCMVIFQLKGRALLWWKMLLPQLNMVVEDVSWELFEERFRERYLSEEFIERQLNEFNALRQGGRTVPEYEARFMEFLWYASHLNTKKLKVNRFVFSLNGNLHAKVRILMPQTLHYAIQKALIVEEELIRGSEKDSSETDKVGVIWCATASDTSQTYTQISWLPERIHFNYTSMTGFSNGHLIGDHNINNNVNCSSNSLGLFSRTDQDSRSVGRHLLLRVPRLLD